MSRGIAVIPVPAGEKNPGYDGWQNLRLASEDVPRYWTNGQNVGALNGEPSGWRVCIDLDVFEALGIAGRFLPPTLTGGRESRRHSHWWYVVPGARNKKFKDLDGSVLLELRSTGCQTIVAPSVHPTGEKYVWHSESGLEIADADSSDLEARCAELATATLVARHLPEHRTSGGGGRHDYALALAGFLLRPGRLEQGLLLKILKAAWDVKGWPSEQERREAHADLEGIVEDTAENIAAGEPVVGGPTLEEMCPGMVRRLCKYWDWSREIHQHDDPNGPEEKEDRPTQAQLLVRCAAGAELFHTPAGEAFAAVPVGGHRETHQIKSKGFRRYLVREFFNQHDRPPGAQALQDALGLLEARAQFDGTEREIYVRVASSETGETVYVDLGNERWEVVEITAEGWSVLPGEQTPVRFRRSRGMLPLPVPTASMESRDDRDGLDDLLRRFINVSDEGAIRLIGAWLVQALRPTGPYPVLLFQGEQGSAKSTAERLVRSLVDPSTAPLRTTPRNERDLVIAATNSWCVAFDNISTLQPWLSDAMCRLSTGGGFSARELYTDSEEVLFDATRPLILNGIADVATRPDLLDRALVVTLPPIPEEKRRPEAELWREFEKARPHILAALFDAVAGALGAAEGVRLEGMPRMADFAMWATAAENALGWEPGAFMDAYSGNRVEATESALEADPVAIAVRELMEDQDEWTGTADGLWKALNELVGEGIRHTKAWPGAPNALSGRLKRLAPALRGIGIEYEDARLSGGERKRAKRLRKNSGVKDRPYRPDRPAGQESSANQKNQAGTISADAGRPRDDAGEKTVPEESAAKEHIWDDGDGRDDDLQPDSALADFFRQPPDWYVRQAKHCANEGASERLLKPLASSVAYEVFGSGARWQEVLKHIKSAMKERSRA
ncbi:MAG TPA: bifunctional DNA primase/polymerase [Rubrobacteraceae bacterium]|nr:bifunctional DNA primase/polymerase [Rubrobacteraceae bacterium]